MRQVSGRRFLAKILTLRQRSDGSTAIEYAMIASLMGVALIAVMSSLGQSTAGTYAKVGAAIEGSPDLPAASGAASMAGASAPP